MSSLRFNLPDDPSRPVLSALSQAFLAKVNALSAAVMEARTLDASKGGKAETAIVQTVQKTERLLIDAKEILSWIYPQTETLSFDRGMQIVRQMQDAGFPSDWAEKTIKEIGRELKFPPKTSRLEQPRICTRI